MMRRFRSSGAPVRAALAATVTVAAAALAAVAVASSRPAGPADPSPANALARNPQVDPGTVLPDRPAPAFTLTDQFGRPVSLSQYRGRAVILAFIDARCTTLCPLTSAEMALAKRMLGPAGRRVALVAVDANPTATSVADAMAYSRAHGLTDAWQFLTGSRAALAKVWRRYGIYVQIERGMIDHTPALYLIDTAGRERRLFMTQMAYAAIGQQSQVLARDVAALLPSHPAVDSHLSYGAIPGIAPGAAAVLETPAGRRLPLAAHRARVVVFFATWTAQTSDLAANLEGLNRYAAWARRHDLPAPLLVDELPTETDAGAVRAYLGRLPAPLSYPVALDATGRLADGYGVEDLPWISVVSRRGTIVYRHDGWLTSTALARAVARSLAPAG
jgi:cytochrome oxidase Cu insertion factor (SCO1/SenC/PrrC family)